MTDDFVEKYNYDVFSPEHFEQWMQWEASPSIGATATDFPLWTLDEQETSLSSLWHKYSYLIIEFGSFT